MTINFDDIIISECFKSHKSYEGKLDRCREYYRKYHCVDSPITCNEKGVLLDGYVRYLVLKENNYTGNIDVEVGGNGINPATYLWGKHRGNNKEYLWRIDDEFNIKPFMEVMAYTKHGLEPILVTRIERLDSPPSTDRKIKKLKIKSIVPEGDQNHGQLLKEMILQSAKLKKDIERLNVEWEELSKTNLPEKSVLQRNCIA